MMPYMSVCSGFFFALKNRGEDAVRGSNYFTEGNLKVAKRMDEICQKYGCSLTQAVLGYLQTREFPCAALYGANNPEQIRDAVGTLEIAFAPEDYRFDF